MAKHTFAIRYAARFGSAPGVYYRWPHGWNPRSAFREAMALPAAAVGELEPWQLSAFLTAGQEIMNSQSAAASDARREGYEERAAQFDDTVTRMSALLDAAQSALDHQR